MLLRGANAVGYTSYPTNVVAGFVKHAAELLHGQLVRAGVEIYEYLPTKLHTKLIVIDDIADTEQWHPRGIEVRGRGEAIAMPTPLIRIHPERIVTWGIESRGTARTVGP